jgi:hypothetical protein
MERLNDRRMALAAADQLSDYRHESSSCHSRHVNVTFALCLRSDQLPERHINLECRVIDTRMVNTTDSSSSRSSRPGSTHLFAIPAPFHHRGRGQFMVAGETIKLPSRMK